MSKDMIEECTTDIITNAKAIDVALKDLEERMSGNENAYRVHLARIATEKILGSARELAEAALKENA